MLENNVLQNKEKEVIVQGDEGHDVTTIPQTAAATEPTTSVDGQDKSTVQPSIPRALVLDTGNAQPSSSTDQQIPTTSALHATKPVPLTLDSLSDILYPSLTEAEVMVEERARSLLQEDILEQLKFIATAYFTNLPSNLSAEERTQPILNEEFKEREGDIIRSIQTAITKMMLDETVYRRLIEEDYRKEHNDPDLNASQKSYLQQRVKFQRNRAISWPFIALVLAAGCIISGIYSAKPNTNKDNPNQPEMLKVTSTILGFFSLVSIACTIYFGRQLQKSKAELSKLPLANIEVVVLESEREGQKTPSEEPVIDPLVVPETEHGPTTSIPARLSDPEITHDEKNPTTGEWDLEKEMQTESKASGNNHPVNEQYSAPSNSYSPSDTAHGEQVDQAKGGRASPVSTERPETPTAPTSVGANFAANATVRSPSSSSLAEGQQSTRPMLSPSH